MLKSFILRRAACAIATSNLLLSTFSTTVLALATTPESFRDIGNDVYATEIQEAAAMKFIAGFASDNTFRPQLKLTREQLVSMVIDALSQLPVSSATVPYDPPPTNLSEVTTKPYWDVEVTRWSAAKIKWGQDHKIIRGYNDGSFRPSRTVTRAELIAVLAKAAEYGELTQNSGPELLPTQSPIAFSDTSNHWANSLIAKMSSYCGVASPLNEIGKSFSPNSAVRRNYAAAATLRMLNCVKGKKRP